MKVALLLGVSEYQNRSVQNLPACKIDLETIEKLLKATKEYDNIKTILTDNKTTIEVKNEIIEFIEKNGKNEIEEVFFYYTGHGRNRDGEFYYQFSDYNLSSFHQTTLSNDYLDSQLRELKATLTVKIIDSCHSGTMYIKDGDNAIIEKFNESNKKFQKCIFMFSSQLSETSFQDKSLSYFTRVFVDAVVKHSEDYIRYRNIQDYIADNLPNMVYGQPQTPFFVSQSNNNEVFCTIDSAISNLEYPQPTLATSEGSHDGETEDKADLLSPLQKAAEEASSKFVDKDQAQDILRSIQTEFEKHQFSLEFKQLYDGEVTTSEELHLLPLKNGIHEWIVQNNVDSYFVRPVYTHVNPDGSNPFRVLTSNLFEQYPNGFDFTVEVPFKYLRLLARNKYRALPMHGIIFTYFISLTNIRVFYFYTHFKVKDWNTHTMDLSEVAWNQNVIYFDSKDHVLCRIRNIIVEFDEFVVSDAKSRLNVDTKT